MAKTFLVVTSISQPNPVLHSLAVGSKNSGVELIVVGDEGSPPDFQLDGCRFYDLEQQVRLGFSFATLCPTKSYSRKNLGYLIALSEQAEIIIETDDDNYPEDAFWTERRRMILCRKQTEPGWTNVYRYFTNMEVWPRGMPLEHIKSKVPSLGSRLAPVEAPIQQGLADGNPDVDAIFRLTSSLQVKFRQEAAVALGVGVWCPFNSQNTTWWRDAAALLYLPSFCSFRMTDIWRSFVAQRIAWECGWSIAFHSSTVRQDRNEHDLMADFRDEIPGYLQNSNIASILTNTRLTPGVENISENLLLCYEALVNAEIVGTGEMALLSAWLHDVQQLD
jgi:hypothetical protein